MSATDDAAPPPPSPETAAPTDAATAETLELRQKLAAAEKSRDEFRDLAQRTMADFQNYKARALKDAQTARRFTVKEVVSGLLPAFDNLERALAAEGEAAVLREGVTLTLQAFIDGLGRLGVTRVVTKGAPFDPSCMEALARLESADHAEGAVISEWESGWRMPELMVRPARVSVAAAPKPAADAAPSGS
jgi:molecular chaperone GrpE